jgi:hypothetical protein
MANIKIMRVKNTINQYDKASPLSDAEEKYLLTTLKQLEISIFN